ncbi:MAG: HIT domain-containing protein [Actinomycetes bacterium]
MTDQCLFCRIVSGEIPADIVSASSTTVAFRDIEPQAPVHVLVISREHHRDLGAVSKTDPSLVSDLVATAQAVAAQEGLEDYRLVFNSGAQAGQSVFHVHGHVLGGRPMGWPPG